jgi:hypothetical protein
MPPTAQLAGVLTGWGQPCLLPPPPPQPAQWLPVLGIHLTTCGLGLPAAPSHRRLSGCCSGLALRDLHVPTTRCPPSVASCGDHGFGALPSTLTLPLPSQHPGREEGPGVPSQRVDGLWGRCVCQHSPSPPMKTAFLGRRLGS